MEFEYCNQLDISGIWAEHEGGNVKTAFEEDSENERWVDREGKILEGKILEDKVPLERFCLDAPSLGKVSFSSFIV